MSMWINHSICIWWTLIIFPLYGSDLGIQCYNPICIHACIHFENVNTQFQNFKLSRERSENYENMFFSPGSHMNTNRPLTWYSPLLEVRWLNISQIKCSHFCFYCSQLVLVLLTQMEITRIISQSYRFNLNSSCHLSVAGAITDFKLWLWILWINSNCHMGISVRVKALSS